MKGTVIVPSGFGRMPGMHDVLASMDIPRVLTLPAMNLSCARTGAFCIFMISVFSGRFNNCFIIVLGLPWAPLFWYGLVLSIYRLARNLGHLSRAKRIGLAIVMLGFLAFFYLVSFRGITTDDTDCQRFDYNAKLNGGIKQVDGTTYIVSICGSGGHANGLFADQNEQVKIVVADAHGSTLATRLFFVFWGGRPGYEPIEIHDGKLFYFDASDRYDSMRSISMPPTTID
ncbi:hypothetical protein [Burkholderia ambifaria]|nr:hypothetical protein [Burkholderia ambifaria]